MDLPLVVLGTHEMRNSSIELLRELFQLVVAHAVLHLLRLFRVVAHLVAVLSLVASPPVVIVRFPLVTRKAKGGKGLKQRVVSAPSLESAQSPLSELWRLYNGSS